MEKEFILSIIIPMYNVENYISKTINSLLVQKVNNMEIIIVDDGSTDNSLQVLLNMISDTEIPIHIYKQANQGQAAARNYGLEKANGKYIAFVDSDDFVAENMYEILIQEAEKNDLDIIQCSYLNWYGDEEEEKKKNFKHRFKYKIDEVVDGKKYFEYQPSLSPCDKLFKKSFLDDMNFKFEVGRYGEDALEISKCFYFAKRIKFIDEVLYYYRRNSYNSTRNSVDIKKSIKLGVDKIFISYELNKFRKSNKWKGNVSRIIIRNIFGSFFKKEMKKRVYRKAVIKELKTRKAIRIVIFNFKLRFIFDFFKLGFEKLILRKT